ncbi:MAG: bifunctional metallophosphatase/5-nucleotidase, partial [Proteobacteria bacterium]|nr:bifunctional metallophosphatase/5-nucleotidase [Pseudomonadota bacterium]
MKRRPLACAVALSLTAGVACAKNNPSTVTVKILAINDFHGQLESPGTFRLDSTIGSPTVPVGGIDWLAGYIT